MPKGIIRPALVKAIATAAITCAAACTPLPYPEYPPPQALLVPSQNPAEALNRLGSDLTQLAPDTQVLTASLGAGACGPSNAPAATTSVIRGAFPEHVLFATASDQPAADAAPALAVLADRIRRDAPDTELTILGHTDAVGSDAYNLDLSRRRALTILRILMARGLDPNHLSAVAIGKRQPVASNETPEGRARNRRVEFLISRCLAANLNVVQARASSDFDARTPVDVMRLDPSGAPGLATIDQVSLRQPTQDQPLPATLAPVPPGRPPVLQSPAGVARPAPAPHYQPRTLAPDAQPNPLGPAVPY